MEKHQGVADKKAPGWPSDFPLEGRTRSNTSPVLPPWCSKGRTTDLAYNRTRGSGWLSSRGVIFNNVFAFGGLGSEQLVGNHPLHQAVELTADQKWMQEEIEHLATRHWWS